MMYDASTDARLATQHGHAMIRPRNVILLTATIQPMADTYSTRRYDPDIRRQDYENALRFYLGLGKGVIDGLLFCENSGADLASLKAIAANENPNQVPVDFVEALSDCPPDYGKGHAELALMDHAYHHAIKGQPESVRYWKITGRLIIGNIAKLLQTAPTGWQLYLDMRAVPKVLRAFGMDRWADTRIIGFTPEGYRRHLLDKRQIVGTPGSIFVVEEALFPVYLDAWQKQAAIVPRFAVQPVMIGVGAESNKDYNNLASRAKNTVRRFTRRFMPSLWL
jgi:hypothetical protein